MRSFRTHVYCDSSPCFADPTLLSVVGLVDCKVAGKASHKEIYHIVKLQNCSSLDGRVIATNISKYLLSLKVLQIGNFF